MDVAVTELSANLGRWLERVLGGHEVAGIQHDIPVASILGLTAAPTLQQLTRQGIIAKPASYSRPTATGRRRPRSRRPVAEIVSGQRS
jgi:antitoxin (DNA-binding transcriptional repressor) of toxin-antitoxin stability system